ncbi:MAG: glycosyl hydrolase 53 family protein [Clostridia bacterium]|nr:glycosyl hydrolase 53 family protein [Clostridia bacterium]
MKYLVGMDVSTLIDLEAEGIKYRDGRKEGELLSILKANGTNSVRVRLWHNPYGESGQTYGAGTCDLPRVIALGKRIKAAGLHFLLDIHYSDFWVDPMKQFPPKAWQNYNLDRLVAVVKTYSAEVLQALKAEGCLPDMIQVGNEITYGMLWNEGKLTPNGDGSYSGYENLCRILNSAIEGIKQVTDCPLMIHLERSYDNPHYREFFDELTARGVRFDAIGFSYYPYWHHGFDELLANMNDMAARYGKDLYIAETSYAFTQKHFSDKTKPLVIGEDFKMQEGYSLPYPLTIEGQRQFCQKLLELLATVKNFKGIYYWEPAWIPSPLGTWASDEARKYIHAEEAGGGNEWANQCLFDYNGDSLPALKEFKKFSDKYNK